MARHAPPPGDTGALRHGHALRHHLRALLPQPLLGATTGVAGILVTALAWALTHTRPATEFNTAVVALCLAAAVVAAYRFPLHIGHHAKLQLATVPYYLMAALLPLPLAATAAGLGALMGELALRRRRGLLYSDVAGAVGRRMLVVLAGALVVQAAGSGAAQGIALVSAAIVMEALEIVTAPLILAPLTSLPPLRIIGAAARDAYLFESAQYLVGLLGALAARQQLWAIALLALPTALVYLAFQAMQRAERAQRQAEDAQASSAAAQRLAEEAVSVRDDFLTTASHDLRTPLTNIVGRIDLIQMRLDSNLPVTADWLRAQINPLCAAADRMFATVEEMSDAAQLQMGEPLPLDMTLVDLGTVVQQVTALVAAPHAERVASETIPGALVYGDRHRLERIFQNLLDNAIKFSPAGSAVCIKVFRERSWLVVRIDDRGSGIPSAELPRIFTRFYRGSNAAMTSGSGIGLAGAKAIVEQHGGRIQVDSTPGRGTTVAVYLPAAAARPEATPPEAPAAWPGIATGELADELTQKRRRLAQ